MKFSVKKILLVAGAFSFLTHAVAVDFTVQNVGMSAFNINGSNNPALMLQRGVTYVFSVSSPGHPFDIKTNSSTTSANRYTNGVAGQGATGGNLIFAVPTNAPDNLFYNCEVHIAMAGTINIINPPTPAILTNASTLTNGTFTFTITGAANHTNIIQASTNLAGANWISLNTNFPATNAYFFTDSNAVQFPGRFYRVVQP